MRVFRNALIILASIFLMQGCAREAQFELSPSVTDFRLSKNAVFYIDVFGEEAVYFDDKEARYGSPNIAIPLWPKAEATTVEQNADVACLRFESPSYSEFFGVKRSARKGDRFTCAEVRFEIIDCDESCNFMIVKRHEGALNSMNYAVHSCFGIVAIDTGPDAKSPTKDETLLLRGEFGLFADTKNGNCAFPRE